MRADAQCGMARPRHLVATPFLAIDRALPISLERQLYAAFRRAIREGLMRAGARLPASRLLAMDLGVSRNTVIDVYRRLITEGYVCANTGAGTFVARQQFARPPASADPEMPLSFFGQAVQRANCVVGSCGAFVPNIPALDQFPRLRWSQLMQARWRSTPLTMSGLDSIIGLRVLREAIAEHIAPMRGIVCDPDQVIITTGRRSGIDCIVRVLADRGDAVMLEDPCDTVIQELIDSLQLRIMTADVDTDGLKPPITENSPPRMVILSPARQNPLGTVMSLGRRYMLLEWAKKHDIVILEDEADAAFNGNSPQGHSLKAIDTRGRVLYAGSFSASLSFFINLGFIIAPAEFVTLLGRARSLTGAVAGAPEQAVLADFIQSGDYARYVLRMSRIYEERRDALRYELTHYLAGPIRAMTDGGLHILAWLAEDMDDAYITRAAEERGIVAPALSSYAIERNLAPALVLGYGSTPPDAIPDAVRKLAIAFECRALVSGGDPSTRCARSG